MFYSTFHKYAELWKKIWCTSLQIKTPGSSYLVSSFSFYLFIMFIEEPQAASHNFETRLVIQLTIYTPNWPTAGSGKNKKETELKSKKTKETMFTVSSGSHLDFLQCLLIKH
jgi:hypothetical protein